VDTKSQAYRIAAICLRIALLLALVWAGWAIYRRLPNDDGAQLGGAQAAGETSLLIILRRSPEEAGNAASNIPVKLYPIDVAAAQREFFDPDNNRSERRAGMRFDDFLAERMKGTRPVETHLDQRGQTTVSIKPGTWWIHAALEGTENVEWHLRVNVSGRRQTIELTPDNAYARTKSF
jgi:hypothetical protein